MNLQQAAVALGGIVSGGRIRCPAPGKGRKNRSLSVKMNPDGSFHATDFSGGDWRVARDHVKALLGLSDDKPVEFRAPVPQIDHDRLARQKTAADIWARSIPIMGTLAETYLASRGLSYDGESLRYYPGGRAMVALITNAVTGEAQGIHRTFLDRDGRAVLMHDGRKKKLMLGAAAGGVVRLSGDEDVTLGLAIAEGIETALAVPFRPVWACLSAGQLAAFPVLAGIEALTIFADNDASGTGQRDGFVCAERWHAAGKEVEMRMLAEVGKDYADLMEAA
ncbi:DUF7146 domain-containing protein [Aquamicrobium defluvii]|uniref:Virulence-associated protein E n=1 Tax=Aquamicrobium defluvii TaxID=69279 RepID=A0A011U077_9HYPH|nr:toprim domain-containing protein [Aquamicrobium defluvii]EXL09792.1 virulence-associated protein E [Aquamicrobium defluvii]EZQ16747.1 virulence-associated protein E [Halopseudomonas bauzanensis]